MGKDSILGGRHRCCRRQRRHYCIYSSRSHTQAPLASTSGSMPRVLIQPFISFGSECDIVFGCPRVYLCVCARSRCDRGSQKAHYNVVLNAFENGISRHEKTAASPATRQRKNTIGSGNINTKIRCWHK